MATNVTREQAICTFFFYVEFNEENVLKNMRKLDDLNELEICYNTDPRQPVLVAKQRILGGPVTWRKYISNAAQTTNKEESLKIGSHRKYTECWSDY